MLRVGRTLPVESSKVWPPPVLRGVVSNDDNSKGAAMRRTTQGPLNAMLSAASPLSSTIVTFPASAKFIIVCKSGQNTSSPSAESCGVNTLATFDNEIDPLLRQLPIPGAKGLTPASLPSLNTYIAPSL